MCAIARALLCGCWLPPLSSLLQALDASETGVLPTNLLPLDLHIRKTSTVRFIQCSSPDARALMYGPGIVPTLERGVRSVPFFADAFQQPNFSGSSAVQALREGGGFSPQERLKLWLQSGLCSHSVALSAPHRDSMTLAINIPRDASKAIMAKYELIGTLLPKFLLALPQLGNLAAVVAG